MIMFAQAFYIPMTAGTYTRLYLFDQIQYNPTPEDASASQTRILYRNWQSGRVLNYPTQKNISTTDYFFTQCMFPVVSNGAVPMVIGVSYTDYFKFIDCASFVDDDAAFQRVRHAMQFGMGGLTSLSVLYAATDWTSPKYSDFYAAWNGARQDFRQYFEKKEIWNEGLVLSENFDIVTLMDDVEYKDLENALTDRVIAFLVPVSFWTLIGMVIITFSLFVARCQQFKTYRKKRASIKEWATHIGDAELIHERSNKVKFVWELYNAARDDNQNDLRPLLPIRPSLFERLPPELVHNICEFVCPQGAFKMSNDFLVLEKQPLLEGNSSQSFYVN
eukprot:TRINITY_DN13226_c0_g1_i1.p1 TRINITY_DN13226_c0_g1~~TRINITY_DN13226_c0_g1_i1.p1  ORF type:complete len:332 (-),score=29.88 TRINITY_DN13226_c0_g1_i1:99-1094(-)